MCLKENAVRSIIKDIRNGVIFYLLSQEGLLDKNTYY